MACLRPLPASCAKIRSRCARLPPGRTINPASSKSNGRAHCGTHVDGSFLFTLTLTDLATCWTECIPLLYKSADAVLAALAQARMLFPFPLRGIDTDCGSEFLNEAVIAYCEQHQLTFT